MIGNSGTRGLKKQSSKVSDFIISTSLAGSTVNSALNKKA